MRAYFAVERKDEERVVGNDRDVLAVVGPVHVLDIAFNATGELVCFPIIKGEVGAALDSKQCATVDCYTW